MAYGEPATVAVAAAPALVKVTLVTESLLTRPEVVNSVPAKVMVVPYVLLALSGGDGERGGVDGEVGRGVG